MDNERKEKLRVVASKLAKGVSDSLITGLIKVLDEHGAEPTAEDTLPTKENPQKIIYASGHSPGDIVMMTAAVRDLHAMYPGQYITDVRCPAPELWEGNPYITPIKDNDPHARRIQAEYPLIHNSNEGSYHFIHGYREHLAQALGRPITQGAMKGDLHVREEEKGWMSVVEEITGDDRPFWIVDAGYKNDFTCKAWAFENYQAVVDHFKDKIQFVQLGHQSHNHPELRGVINLVGQTDLRQLVRLFYHSVGVLTPVSMPMVLAAAVPFKSFFPKNRACVVISGGREPVQWQMYPYHQFLHTEGTMGCCDHGGCWSSRAVPIGDGDIKDKTNLCVDAVHLPNGQHIARCMYNITVADVIRAIERWYNLNGNAKSRGVFKYDKRPTIHKDYDASARDGGAVPETGGAPDQPKGRPNDKTQDNENDAPQEGAESDKEQKNDDGAKDSTSQKEDVGSVTECCEKEEQDEQSKV